MIKKIKDLKKDNHVHGLEYSISLRCHFFPNEPIDSTTCQDPNREFCKTEQADYKFIKFNKLFTKFSWKGTTRIAKHFRKKKVRGLPPDFKANQDTVVLVKDRLLDQWK